MKKIIFFLLTITSLAAAPKAIVFDFNGVMTYEVPDQETIYSFLNQTLHLSRDEFERVYEAMMAGRIDPDFWRSLAKEKKATLTQNWKNRFEIIMKNAFARPEMFALVNQLNLPANFTMNWKKDCQIQHCTRQSTDSPPKSANKNLTPLTIWVIP
jgi:hypothetical protein